MTSGDARSDDVGVDVKKMMSGACVDLTMKTMTTGDVLNWSCWSGGVLNARRSDEKSGASMMRRGDWTWMTMTSLLSAASYGYCEMTWMTMTSN